MHSVCTYITDYTSMASNNSRSPLSLFLHLFVKRMSAAKGGNLRHRQEAHHDLNEACRGKSSPTQKESPEGEAEGPRRRRNRSQRTPRPQGWLSVYFTCRSVHGAGRG